MANTVIALKKSATPSSVPADLANGELAINYADGKLYYKAANGTIASISGNEPNYFGTVNANNTLVVADTPGDVFTLASGNNIAIIGDAINDKITISLVNDVVIPSTGTFKVSAVGNDEGGEIKLGNAITNSVLSGDVIIDIFQNRLRFFESGGTNRGAFINIASASTGVGTDLLAGASATDTTARNAAGAAFDKANIANITADLAFNKANAALPNVSGVSFNGNLTVSQNLSADRIFSTNNGLGENFKVGDDAWIGDFNIANSIRIKGQQNSQIGYVVFGDQDGKALGRAGTGALTYDSNTVWHAGNDGAGSGLDADLLDGQHGSYYGIATDVTAANRVANDAFLHANSGYAFANSISITANLAFAHANAAFANGNTVIQTAQSAFTQSNAAYLHANAAFSSANAGQATANASYAFGNSAHSIANLAFTHANAAFLSSNSVNTYSDATYIKLTAASQTITGNVNIVGDLTLSGNTFAIDATRLEVDDPLLYLAANNYTSDIVDIGFIANYVNATGQNVHTGLYREHEDKMYYLFQGYDKEPINNHIGALSNNMTLAVLNADLRTSNLVLGGANAILTIGASFNHANAAHASANAGMAIGNGAFASANAGQATANAAFNRANTANITADRAFNHANAAFATVNSAFGVANTALPNTSGVAFSGNLNLPTGNLAVGIATPNTGARLQVYNTTGNSELWITADNGFDPFIRMTGENGATIEGFFIQYDNSVGDTYFKNIYNGTAAFHFQTAAVEAFTIQTDGKVGVGTTSPGYILDVKGTGNVSSSLLVNDMNVKPTITAAFAHANLAHAHANASYAFSNSAHSIANLAFTHANGAFAKANAALANSAGITTAGSIIVAGNVSLTWPGGTSRRIGSFYDNNYRSGMYLGHDSRILTIFSTSSDTAGHITFNTRLGAGSSDEDYGTERARITNTGNVLIGRAVDSTVGQNVKLDVAGAINASAVLLNGTALTSGGATLNVVNDTVNATRYLMFANGTSGTSSLNVAVGLAFTPSSNTLNINGALNAVTKSFVIPHPVNEGMFLRYGSLEGPENGVYVRGKIEGKSIIELPEYWWNLIDQDTITVNLTPYGRSQDIWVQSTCAHFIHLNQQADCFFTVFAERKDVDKLVVEY